MAYMTRHWLLGDRKQNSHYRPVQVALEAGPGATEWEIEHKTAVVLTATKPNKDFAKLLLNQAEIEDLAVYLMRRVSPQIRNKIINRLIGLNMDKSHHPDYR